MKNIGGSILPSGSPQTYQPKEGPHGTFEVRRHEDIDTHGLWYARNQGDYAGHFILVAMHPNGYSCDELAKRIIAAWNGSKHDPVRSRQQFDYILACGGSGISHDRLGFIIAGTM